MVKNYLQGLDPKVSAARLLGDFLENYTIHHQLLSASYNVGGPSAGYALAINTLSALLLIPVYHDFGITGAPWTKGVKSGEVGGSVLTLPDTLFQGAAALGPVKIRTRRALQPDDGIDVTSFHVVAGEECLEVEIFGDWKLYDAHRDGLVLATSEPFPSVMVIDWAWFEGILTQARCGT